MTIKQVSCTQFAGVRDRAVSFDDGINVVFGKNESGKSTLVNLISRTLFQNARLDRRSDKDFFDLYFPSAKKGGTVTGDFADGKIAFETESGVFTLSKEWGADARCMLSTPDGVIRDPKTIDTVLKEALLYGEGVYADMLFSSQRNTDVSLQALLDASNKTDAKQELAQAVSRAFAQSDGVAVEAVEQAIAAKIDEIAGKHWDDEREMPVRKAGRWANGLGDILKAYYALEDAQTVLDEISRLEHEADRAAAVYMQQDAAAREAQEAFARFQSFAGRLAVQTERQNTVKRLQAERAKLDEVLNAWPTLTQKLDRARALQEEKTNRAVSDAYTAAKQIADERDALASRLEQQPCPSAQEIAQVKAARHEEVMLENALCGMNLTAAIRMLGDHEVCVTSLRTGETIDISDGTAAITEAVTIAIPGVMEMQLAPANVDAADVQARLALARQDSAAVLKTYGVSTVEELEALAKTYAQLQMKLDAVSTRLTAMLGATTFEMLKQLAAELPETIREKADIERDILLLCGDGDAARFVTAAETIVQGYAAEYGSINELKVRAFDLEVEWKKATESLASDEEVPAEYRGVTDPEAQLAYLQRERDEWAQRREAALTAKTAAASKRDTYQETIVGDPVEDVAQARRVFEEQRSLLHHWQHIAQVFKTQKEQLRDNPMQDIADRFAHYLGVISGGKVASEFPLADKLQMTIYSDGRTLDYGKLSEGTKETVSLAFRLATLDHLFPDGGGVIVFDDPFTDMDAERTAQSCELIKECAKRHQVIFLTCKEDYILQLGGNTIRI